MISNNLFNIRYSSRNFWKGQLGAERGFVRFSDTMFSVRAIAILLLRTYRQLGIDTIRGVITRYAPPEDDNPTERYIEFCADYMGMPGCSDTPLTSLDEYVSLISAIQRFELGESVVSDAYIRKCILYFYKEIKPFKLLDDEEREFSFDSGCC